MTRLPPPIHQHTIIDNFLDREQEITLGWRIQRGLRAQRQLPLARTDRRKTTLRAIVSDGTDAEHILVAANTPLVLKMSQAMCRRARNEAWADEAFGYAQIGLIRAAREYRPWTGNRFSSCAWHWIRTAMFRGFHATGYLIRPPAHRHKEAVHVRFFFENRAYNEATCVVDSRDAPFATALEVLEGTEALQQAVAQLSERERRVVQAVHELWGTEKRLYRELGRELGCTRENIRIIHDRAIQKLRNMLGVGHLPKFRRAREHHAAR